MLLERVFSTAGRRVVLKPRTFPFINTASPVSVIEQRAAMESAREQRIASRTVDALTTLQRQEGRLFARLMLHTFNFTVTDGDYVRTHRLKGVRCGDVLKLDKVRTIGSAEHELRGRPFIDPAMHDIRAIVVESCGRGLRVKTPKRRRRKGIYRSHYSNPLLTTLCVQRLRILIPSSLLSQQRQGRAEKSGHAEEFGHAEKSGRPIQAEKETAEQV